MIDAVINHLWQSTLCALAAALLTLVFRKNGAKVRFRIWLAASVKFLMPFSLFVWVGEYLRWEKAPSLPSGSEFSILMGQIAQPAVVVTREFALSPSGNATLPWSLNAWTILLSIWLLGSLVLLNIRLAQWLRLRAIVKASSPLDINAPIPVRETTSTLEPGIFGVFSPTLLMPAGIASLLAPAQLDAVLAHELCHWRRRDNLTATLHILVEVMFWFHPLVWWLGGRLVVERERACDESVIQSGRDRKIYAEGILKICQRYAELPSFASGVSGGLLRKRIEGIMTNPILSKLPIAKRCLLSSAALVVIATPIALGLTGGAGAAPAATTNAAAVKHYRNDEWKFELDIPKQWVVMPPDTSNGPEVIRFHSQEGGPLALIVWRSVSDSPQSSDAVRHWTQKVLAKAGYANFVSSKTSIGTKQVATLDFDLKLPDGSLLNCRHYFIVDGTVEYVFGFGASSRGTVFDTFDRVAKSFALARL